MIFSLCFLLLLAQVPTCTVAFHVECAFQQSLKMKCRIDQAISDGVRNEVSYHTHMHASSTFNVNTNIDTGYSKSSRSKSICTALQLKI